MRSTFGDSMNLLLSRPLRPGLIVSIILIALLSSLGKDSFSSPVPLEKLEDLSLEDLINIKVTSVSKREQNLRSAGAAISVLGQEDLQRSGANTIADVLRVVPGMNVGAVNSIQWAVSSRGFNSLYSNKLLVLVDGRAVYNPFYTGVFWDMQRPMFEDLNRIEVIRGPGATIWGANAVNGVINIVSESAKDTQGTFLYGGGGDIEQGLGGLRYGGRIGERTYYRVFGSFYSKSDYPLSTGLSAEDDWQGWHGGFRFDHYSNEDTQLTWQADVTTSEFDDGASDAYNFNTIGRWTQDFSNESSFEAQVYYDRTQREEIRRATVFVDTLDFSANQNFKLGDSHELIWGLGYRHTNTVVEKIQFLGEIRKGDQQHQLFSAFIQDEIQIIPERLDLTAGLKVEHNEINGFEFQPSVRAVYELAEDQVLWAAISRAIRTPSLIEGEDMLTFPLAEPFMGMDGGIYIPTVFGNANPDSEVLWAYEIGYRSSPGSTIDMDLALFYNQYDNLISISGIRRLIPGNPVGIAEIVLDNFLRGDTYGGEIEFNAKVMEDWILSASYSLLQMRLDESDLLSLTNIPEESPEHQFVLRSTQDVNDKFQISFQARYVDSINMVPSYLTGDFQLSYQFDERLEGSIIGSNLFQSQHAEQGAAFVATTAEVPRSVFAKLTWRF